MPFQHLLRMLSVVIFAIAALRLFMGTHADLLLGALLPASAPLNATLDSQTRFYGSVMAIYGVILWLTSTNLERYEHVFKAGIAIFFMGGLGRLLSIAVVGMPSPMVLVLLALELILPPILWFRYNSARKASS